MTFLSVQRLLAFFFYFISYASSFAPSRISVRSVTSTSLYDEKNPSVSEGVAGVGRFFGIVATVSALSFGSLPTVAEADTESLTAISSSSVEIADTIRTLDMSLPSYNDISSSKTSVENTKSLSVDQGAQSLGVMTSRSKRASSSSSASSSSTNPMGSFLPSMSKKSAASKQAEKTKKPSALPEYEF